MSASTQTILLTNVEIWDTAELIDLVVAAPIEFGDKPQSIDGTGLVLAPGLVDVHVHFRDPGQKQKEDMVSGSLAAAAGGFTDVALQPNTIPAADGEPFTRADPVGKQLLKQGFISVLDYWQLYEDAFEQPLSVNYTCVAAASRGRLGQEVSRDNLWEPFLRGELADAGHPVVALSDDGSALADSLVLQTLETARFHGIPVMEHCERGKDEVAIIERDIAAVRQTGAHVHFQHVSTKAAFDLIRAAKSDGLPVTCETAPHYFALSDTALAEYGSAAKMNPPLRSEEDRQATIAAIADGTVDLIATDHAPHTADDKAGQLETAANGIVGLETSYGLAVTELVDTGVITHCRLIELMSLYPAHLVGLPRVRLSELPVQADEGARRLLDLTTFQPETDEDGKVTESFLNLSLLAPRTRWTVEAENFMSKGRNAPFDGWQLTGMPVATVHNGELIDVTGRLKGDAWTA